MQRAVIIRLKKTKHQTLGHFSLFEGTEKMFECKTLELADNNNKQFISCIPEGRYKVARRYNDRYKLHFLIQDLESYHVKNRKWILIHIGNFNRNTKGCILLGRDHVDIDRDGLMDVTSSRSTFKVLNAVSDDVFLLDIF